MEEASPSKEAIASIRMVLRLVWEVMIGAGWGMFGNGPETHVCTDPGTVVPHQRLPVFHPIGTAAPHTLVLAWVGGYCDRLEERLSQTVNSILCSECHFVL